MITNQYEQIVEEIINKYNPKPVKEAFILLVKLFNNIINFPLEPKYKNFKKSNHLIKTKILLIKETLSLITTLGYTNTEDDDILSFTGHAGNLRTCVLYLNKKIKEMESELKEGEDIIREKEERKKRANFEEAQRKAREEKIEKEKILRQIENDKKERALRGPAHESRANQLKYGAREIVFKPSCGAGGG